MGHRLAALILAAGSGTRMGRLKQLLPLGDRPVLKHGIDCVRAAGVSEIVVVCGADPGKYAPFLADSGVRLVPNEKPGSEMADSVRLGLGQMRTGTFSGILVCLADHPLVLPETCRTLIRLHRENADKIIIPSFAGKRGHPALFPYTVISDIFKKTSLRDIVREDPARVLVAEVEDEGVALDMDTEADYQKAVALYQIRMHERQQTLKTD